MKCNKCNKKINLSHDGLCFDCFLKKHPNSNCYNIVFPDKNVWLPEEELALWRREFPHCKKYIKYLLEEKK